MGRNWPIFTEATALTAVAWDVAVLASFFGDWRLRRVIFSLFLEGKNRTFLHQPKGPRLRGEALSGPNFGQKWSIFGGQNGQFDRLGSKKGHFLTKMGYLTRRYTRRGPFHGAPCLFSGKIFRNENFSFSVECRGFGFWPEGRNPKPRHPTEKVRLVLWSKKASSEGLFIGRLKREVFRPQNQRFRGRQIRGFLHQLWRLKVGVKFENFRKIFEI